MHLKIKKHLEFINVIELNLASYTLLDYLM
jgi:hypothetical protein